MKIIWNEKEKKKNKKRSKKDKRYWLIFELVEKEISDIFERG